jgi:hypothetical protein
MREYTTSNDAKLLREMNLGDNYICNAINDGFPLCCVVSTDNFLKHDMAVYKKSIIITPVPESKAILDKLITLARNGIGTIVYGTKEKLKEVEDTADIVKLDVEKNTELMRKASAALGYQIRFKKKVKTVKPPTMAIIRRSNGLLFSVYNANTTTKTQLRFPLGAAILCGCETEIRNGFSSYHFSRAEHRECRVFVEQKSGIISCREAPPVNARFRRAIKITGLIDATVCLLPEADCEAAVSVAKSTDRTPEFDPRFKLVHDEIYGTYLKGENVNGNIYFLMGSKTKG